MRRTTEFPTEWTIVDPDDKDQGEPQVEARQDTENDCEVLEVEVAARA